MKLTFEKTLGFWLGLSLKVVPYTFPSMNLVFESVKVLEVSLGLGFWEITLVKRLEE